MSGRRGSRYRHGDEDSDGRWDQDPKDSSGRAARSRRNRRVRDGVLEDPWRFAKSKGMLGSLGFWFIIWAFCGFSSSLFPIFLGIALLQGWGWEEKASRSRKRGYDSSDETDEGFEETSGQGGGIPDRPASLGQTQDSRPVLAGLNEKIIADAAPARAQLDAAAAVASGELGERLRRMSASTEQISRILASEPAKLHEVQRVFTYYLPAAADLIAARGGLMAPEQSTRLAEVDAMLGRLDAAFADFLALAQGRDARSIDIDIRLLEQSLDQEFAGRVRK
jgi:hypothetical protein